jgi:hypothetical protein
VFFFKKDSLTSAVPLTGDSASSQKGSWRRLAFDGSSSFAACWKAGRVSGGTESRSSAVTSSKVCTSAARWFSIASSKLSRARRFRATIPSSRTFSAARTA